MRTDTLASIVLVCCLSLGVACAAAKGHLTLYKKPHKDAAVVAVIVDQRTLVPIYYQKHSDWVKLANTQDGQVGWAKIRELNKQALRWLRPDRRGIGWRREVHNAPGTYRVIKYTVPEKMDEKEAEKRMAVFEEKMQRHSRRMRLFMREMLQDVFEDVSADFPAMLSVFLGDEDDDLTAQKRVIVRDSRHEKSAAPSWWERLKARLSGE